MNDPQEEQKPMHVEPQENPRSEADQVRAAIGVKDQRDKPYPSTSPL